MAPIVEDDSAFGQVRMPELGGPGEQSLAQLARNRDTARAGTALLVLSAAVSFVALIVAYSAFRACQLEVFLFGRYYLDSETGLFASLALLLSVFTAGLAARYLATARPRAMRRAIALTIALAAAFLAIQGRDFLSKAERGLLPGARFVPTEEVWSTEAFAREHPAATQLAQRLDARWLTITNPPDAPAAQSAVSSLTPAQADARAHGLLRKIGVLGPAATFANVPSRPRNAHVFWGLYLLLMGMHAAYLLVGLVGWTSLLVRSRSGELGPEALTRLDGVMLFWKFLGVVWVVLLALFYLVH